jgi:hypothetical protein
MDAGEKNTVNVKKRLNPRRALFFEESPLCICEPEVVMNVVPCNALSGDPLAGKFTFRGSRKYLLEPE